MAQTKKKRARRKKAVVEPVSMIFTCDDVAVAIDHRVLQYSVTSASCEMCGSHETVKVWFRCPHCNRDHEITVYDV